MDAPARQSSDVAPPPGVAADPRSDPPIAQHSEPSVYLALGVHNHQPVGNFDWVFEQHYQEAYLPFLEAMEAHPRIPFSMHASGPLLRWLAAHRPAYLARLRTMIATGRVEMKGGGFYEPVLAIIPESDSLEQLRRMQSFLEEHLGIAPTGVWPAERVWEPHLPRVFTAVGLEYAVLDDSHFLAAGVPEERTYGYYVTEDQGHRFDLFPISKDLRYLIPFREPQETINFLRRLGEGWADERQRGGLPPKGPPPLAVYDDDGEKFGGWPDTHAHVYEARWLERFLAALEEASAEGWLGLTTPGRFRACFPALGRAYVPTASYAEMLEWSGGFFRNFLVRYDEANLLHKRMLYTSGRVSKHLAAVAPDGGARALETTAGSSVGTAAPSPAQTTAKPSEGRARELEDALLAHDHVLQAQCNDAYWHGIFGGLYLPHLRDAVTRNLLAAERLLGAAAGPSSEIIDIDQDGEEEVVLRSPELVAMVSPTLGGSLLTLDHLASGYALLNSLRRRHETEHDALEDPQHGEEPSAGTPTHGAPPARTIHETVRSKEPGLARLLFEDPGWRTAFRDRCLPPDVTLADVVAARAPELGDFFEGAYELLPDGSVDRPADPSAQTDPERSGGTAPSVGLRRSGEAAGATLTVEKRYALGDATALFVDYRVAVESASGVAGSQVAAPERIRFGPELTVNLLAGWEPDRYVLIEGRRPPDPALAADDTHDDVSMVSLVDEHAGIEVALSWTARLADPDASAHAARAAAKLYRYGVVTVSRSEDGFERIYQGTALLPTWEVPLREGVSLSVELSLRVTTPRERRP